MGYMVDSEKLCDSRALSLHLLRFWTYSERLGSGDRSLRKQLRVEDLTTNFK